MTGVTIDSGVPHPARRYNYWLGGTDNFAADRKSGDLLAAAYPAARIADVYPRSGAEFASFFDGLSLVDPGIVAVGEWRPDPAASEHPAAVDASIFGAVGRVPPGLTAQ